MIYTSGREHKQKATQLFRFLISAIQFVNSISEQNKLIIVNYCEKDFHYILK